MSNAQDLEAGTTNSRLGFLTGWIPSRNIRLTNLTPEEQLIQDEPWLNLSKFDKLVLFAITMSGSLSCYIICFLLFPVLALKPRKFGVLWSIGSILFLAGFSILQGVRSYFKSLVTKERLWFSVTFVTSVGLTLFSSVYLKNWLLSLVFCGVQLVSQLAYTISYFPFGRGGLRIVGDYATGQVDNWIHS